MVGVWSGWQPPSWVAMVLWASDQASPVPFWPFLVLLIVLFYVLLIRPEMASKKRHEQMLKNLKQGDQVVTIGGIVGRIVSLDQDTVVIRVEDNARLRVLRSAIARMVSEEKKSEAK